MNNIKNYVFSFVLVFIILSFLLIIFSGLFYINLVNLEIYKFFKIILVMISVFFGSFILGKKCESKGYLNGLIFGLIIICLMFILGIFVSKLQLKTLFYYFIIICCSVLGGTIGIRKKKT